MNISGEGMGDSSGKAIIIAHGDVDGMVCAAQLIRKEKSNCELVFSNAKYIASSLKRILTVQNKPNRVYIADIPANSKAVENVEALANDGVDVYWIDHHPWSGNDLMSRLNSVCKKVVYNEALSTPAGVLMGSWLKEEDPYYDKIGQLCYAFAKGTDWERKWFRLLATYIGKSDRIVLERLAYDRAFTEDDLGRIEQQERSEQMSEEILRKDPDNRETKTEKTIAVYDTSELSGIYLGRKVFKYHDDVDYCLIRISERNWQLASNPSKKHSLELLMGMQDIDSIPFSFAGRKNALLAIVLERKHDNIESHECLIDWLCEHL